MQLPLYQVDAFADAVFRGNPAAVCPLPRWLDDAVLQAIAAENALSETAFFVPDGDRFALRWFTPVCEVDLCGHATLASAYVILELLEPGRREVTFGSRSGDLVVARDGARLAMTFPSRPPSPCAAPERLLAALGQRPVEVLAARDYMMVYAAEDDVRALAPDMTALAEADDRLGVIVTAPVRPGSPVDFVSRFFAPRAGIPEDPVTGSAHCTLVPYWSARLGKTHLRARQVSRRGGDLTCDLRGDRVIIAGTAVLYLRGTIEVSGR